MGRVVAGVVVALVAVVGGGRERSARLLEFESLREEVDRSCTGGWSRQHYSELLGHQPSPLLHT